MASDPRIGCLAVHVWIPIAQFSSSRILDKSANAVLTTAPAAELMEALDEASKAAEDKVAALEAAVAECAAKTDLDAAEDAIAALQKSTQALAEANEAQAEAVAGKLHESDAALDALRCAPFLCPTPHCRLVEPGISTDVVSLGTRR